MMQLMGSGLRVGQQILDLLIGVRIPAPQHSSKNQILSGCFYCYQ